MSIPISTTSQTIPINQTIAILIRLLMEINNMTNMKIASNMKAKLKIILNFKGSKLQFCQIPYKDSKILWLLQWGANNSLAKVKSQV